MTFEADAEKCVGGDSGRWEQYDVVPPRGEHLQDFARPHLDNCADMETVRRTQSVLCAQLLLCVNIYNFTLALWLCWWRVECRCDGSRRDDGHPERQNSGAKSSSAFAAAWNSSRAGERAAILRGVIGWER